MQLSVTKSNLEAALAVADIGIGSGDDISSHFVFRIRNGKAEVLASDMRVSVLTPINECQVEGEDGKAFTVEAARLKQWLGVRRNTAEITISNLEDGEVRIASGSSAIEIPSLDPSKHPDWEKVFEDTKKTAVIKASRLATALAYVRNFISDKDDTTRPEIAQTEVLKGVLWSTDKKAMALVTIDVLADSNLRILGKNIPATVKFLSQAGDEDVSLHEHERQLFIQRSSGAVFGVVKPNSAFPTFNVDREEGPNVSWELNTQELIDGIRSVAAAAENMANPRIRFTFDNGKVLLGVRSVSGKRNVEPINVIESDGTENLPDDGFSVDQSYVDKVVKQFSPETLKFAIHKRDSGGFIRFRYTPVDNTDDYLTVVVWRI